MLSISSSLVPEQDKSGTIKWHWIGGVLRRVGVTSLGDLRLSWLVDVLFGTGVVPP